MERVSKSQAQRKGPPKLGPKTKQEHEKTRVSTRAHGDIEHERCTCLFEGGLVRLDYFCTFCMACASSFLLIIDRIYLHQNRWKPRLDDDDLF